MMAGPADNWSRATTNPQVVARLYPILPELVALEAFRLDREGPTLKICARLSAAPQRLPSRWPSTTSYVVAEMDVFGLQRISIGPASAGKILTARFVRSPRAVEFELLGHALRLEGAGIACFIQRLVPMEAERALRK